MLNHLKLLTQVFSYLETLILLNQSGGSLLSRSPGSWPCISLKHFNIVWFFMRFIIFLHLSELFEKFVNILQRTS